MSEKIYPGKHPFVKEAHFNDEEKAILDILSKEFYVTSGGNKVELGFNSEYRYAIISPTDIYKDMFNLDREIIVVFSRYKSLEARTLSVFEHITKKHSTLRIEKICNVLFSMDENIETSLSDLVKDEPESQIIIPFKYSEISNKIGPFYFRNRFKKYFYSRDLFAFEAPLKKDIYFFGRSDLIQSLINRLKSGENSGLFGLRKTGKTSLINGIERNLKKENIDAVIIDCQDTSFNQRRWYEALYYLCLKTKEALNVDIKLPSEIEFTTKNSSVLTETFFSKCKSATSNQTYIIFDEIENISRNTSPAEHWRTGLDFVLFWQTMRSIFQRNNNLISYLIVGTNPSCIELSKIENTDNPIFNHVSPAYIPGFDVQETREMVRRLGKRMGLRFDETVYGRLTEDFGGHPFLIRHVCSLISRKVSGQDRPVTIGKRSYEQGKEDFILNHSNYLEMIVNILKDVYPEEYNMLTLLANEERGKFNDLTETNPSLTAHLIGYGLLKKDNLGFDYNIEAIKDYILKQSKYQKTNLSPEEMWAEVSERRNSLEQNLRKLISLLLRSTLGENNAKQAVLDIFGSPRKEKYKMLSYRDVFDPIKSEIYFSDLSKIISKHWDAFKHSFKTSKTDTFKELEFINHNRGDAHAKAITKEKFAYLRICLTTLEDDLDDLV